MHSKRMVITAVTIVLSLLLAVGAGAQPVPAVPDEPASSSVPQAQGPGNHTVYLPLVLSNYVPVAERYQEA